MDSWIRCRVDLYVFFLRCFNILCYASGFYMLLFVVRCLWCARMRARVCVIHWHCTAQLSMFNMEKRHRNKIIIIIIINYLFSTLICNYLFSTLICKCLLSTLICNNLFSTLICNYLFSTLICKYIFCSLICKYLFNSLICKHLTKNLQHCTQRLSESSPTS